MAFSGTIVELSAGPRARTKPAAGTTPMAALVSLSTKDADAALLHRIKDGDRAAAALLVDQYLNRIVAYAFRMLGDRAEAEDVAQETFLRLWRRADQWRAEAPLIHWLHRVAYNLCIDRLRKKKPLSLDVTDEPADPAQNPAAALAGRQLGEAVRAAIQGLPDRQRAAIVLVHQEGLGNIETAAIMDLSVEAVESLLARGRRALKVSLARLRPELEGEI